MSQVHEMTALELGAALRRRELGVLEATVHFLERAERLGPQVGAFSHLAVEHALARAATLDADPSLAADSLLRGVPCPMKELAMVQGLPWTAGSAVFAGRTAPADDGVTMLLRRAGTVVLGKTTSPEFGLPCYTEPDTTPPARTPWDLRRSAGGSSGGAAAAVAAGLAPLAHGTDGGGSIRIPASACGLVGLKPSRGRISFGPHGTDGVALASHGVLSRTVRDTAAALDVLDAPWPGDGFRLPAPTEGFLRGCDAPPHRLRVGLLARPSNVDTTVHPACLRALEATATLLEELGHEVVEAAVPYPVERWAAFMDLWSVMALQVPVPPGREDELRPLTRWLREHGRRVSGLAHAQAVVAAQRLARDAATAWQGLDVVCTPTLAQPPALVGQLRCDEDPERDFWDQTRFTPWTSTANLTGRPSISLPLHREHLDGRLLPIGVMFTGVLGDDETLLRLAAELEAASPWPSGPVPQGPAAG